MRSTPALSGLRRPLAPVLVLAALAACQPAPGPVSVPLPETAGALGPEVVRRAGRGVGPAGAAPGTCWSRDETPAHVETVTEQVMVAPAETGPDGRTLRPAEFRVETRARIVQEREEVWFRTPCPEELTPALVASLQRALQVRGLHPGPVTGEMDAPTRAAVRAFQRPRGLDSGLLSLAAARQLGLVAVDFGERPR